MLKGTVTQVFYRPLVMFGYFIFILLVATTTYVVGTPKNRRNETILLRPKHIFKLIGKTLIAKFCSFGPMLNCSLSISSQWTVFR